MSEFYILQICKYFSSVYLSRRMRWRYDRKTKRMIEIYLEQYVTSNVTFSKNLLQHQYNEKFILH